jgi:2-polyprenyl-3-methyl-5-hydroxy-6-metoxy-1,4-benzoquinol methylase
MRHHRQNQPDVRDDIADILKDKCPDDAFSLEMWRVGIDFYQRKLKVLLQPTSRVLDVGCGTGCWSIAAARLGAKVTGIDLSAARIACASAIAKHMGLSTVEFKTASLSAQANTGQRYDIIICNNTIQYIPNFNVTMGQIGQMLPAGGTLMLSSTDVGIIPYLVAECVSDLNARKLLDTFKALAIASRPHRRELHNGAFIAQAKMRKELERRGFRRHANADDFISAGTLIPPRLMGLPLYYETIYTSGSKDEHEK